MEAIFEIIKQKRAELKAQVQMVRDIKEVSAAAKEWDVVKSCKEKLAKLDFADSILYQVETKFKELEANGHD